MRRAALSVVAFGAALGLSPVVQARTISDVLSETVNGVACLIVTQASGLQWSYPTPTNPNYPTDSNKFLLDTGGYLLPAAISYQTTVQNANGGPIDTTRVMQVYWNRTQHPVDPACFNLPIIVNLNFSANGP